MVGMERKADNDLARALLPSLPLSLANPELRHQTGVTKPRQRKWVQIRRAKLQAAQNPSLFVPLLILEYKHSGILKVTSEQSKY